MGNPIGRVKNYFVSPDPSCICPRCFHTIYYGQCAVVDSDGNSIRKKPEGEENIKKARKNPYPLDELSTEKIVYRVCYECNYQIPYNYEQSTSIFLSVIGYSMSGKSHYLASFRHQAQEEMSGNPNFYEFGSLKSEAEQRFQTDYNEPLYENNEEITTTPGTLQMLDPLLILRFQVRRLGGKTFNLVIHDIAGEDFADKAKLRNVGRFVRHTNAFIFLVDPVTIEPVFQDLESALKTRFDDDYGHDKSTRSPYLCFLDVINAFPAAWHWPPTGYPIAIVLSKADLLNKLVAGSALIKSSPLVSEIRNAQSQWSNPKNNKSDLDYLKEIDEVNGKVQDFLQGTGQGGFSGLNDKYHIKFFAVSATGSTSDDSHKFSIVKPNRCLDPVVWLLDVLDYGMQKVGRM